MNLKLLLIGGLLIGLLVFRIVSFHPQEFTDNQHLDITTTLLSEPQMVGKFQKIVVKMNGYDALFITLGQNPAFHYGQTLHLVGNVKRGVINNEKVINTIYFPSVEIEKNAANPALALTSFFRQQTTRLFQETLPPDGANLLLGIVFGIKEQMPKVLQDNLRTSGVTHIIVASGMNVTMTAGFLMAIFTVFLRRQFALLLSIAGILFYALLAGFEPPIMRASIMAILAFSGQAIGRQSSAPYGLFLAGLVMLFMDPLLLEDVGFQLSFLSTLGLMTIQPALGSLLKSRSDLVSLLVSDDVLTTVAAQIATLPVMLAGFGTYSLWSVVVNGLVLWTVPLLMVLGGVAAVVGLLLPVLGKLFLYLCFPLLLYFEGVVNFFAGLGGVVKLEQFPWMLVVGYYCLLVAVLLVFRSQKPQPNL